MSALPLPQITLVAKSCVQIPLWFIQAGRCAAISEFDAPIERNGEILGYIWANELTEDIRRQAWKMDVRIIIVLTAGLLISLLLIVLFSVA